MIEAAGIHLYIIDNICIKEGVKFTDGTVIDLQSLQIKVQFLLNSLNTIIILITTFSPKKVQLVTTTFGSAGFANTTFVLLLPSEPKDRHLT